MFSAKHSFADMREQKKKTKIGVVCQNGQRCFFWSFFGFWWFCFFGFSVFLCFCFVHNSPKWLFSCIFRGFLSILFPQKACLKLSMFFLFCFFCLCLPFQKSIFFFAFLSINPFLEKTLCGVSFVFLLLAFSFPNVCLLCLKQTFLTSPFLNPSCFHYWQFIFFFCCSCFCFHGVCFSLSVSMLACFWYFVVFHLCFCFCLVACFAFSL